MPKQSTPTLPASSRQLVGVLRMIATTGALAGLLAFVWTSTALAGTYVIDNCPSAPVPNGNAGPWSVFGATQAAKGSCSGGPGDYIAPRGSLMSPSSSDGVQVTVPAGSGITIREAKVWWAVPEQTSGATTFALARALTGSTNSLVGEYDTPLEQQGKTFVLPSTSTSFVLEDFCSNDDAGAGCTLGASESNDLELYGAQLTLADSTLPTGKITGGGLAAGGTLSGNAGTGVLGC